MKVTAIVQARMGSTRLPRKVMRTLIDKTVLEHIIERLKKSKKIDSVVIATTVNSKDDIIAEEALRIGVPVFRGSEEDVLSRYYYAAKESKADIIVRITSDCPLIDPNVIDDMIGFYCEKNYDMVTNGGQDLSNRTYPRGLDAAIFSFETLEETYNCGKEQYEKEHVTPYIYENKKVFYYKNDVDYSKHRWTLDTQKDWELMSAIYDALYKGEHDFYMDEIINLFIQRPELLKINEKIKQKKY